MQKQITNEIDKKQTKKKKGNNLIYKIHDSLRKNINDVKMKNNNHILANEKMKSMNLLKTVKDAKK